MLILLVHVTIALGSLVYTSFAWFQPSTRRLHVSYALVGATLLSGTYLAISTHSNMLSACQTGLAYLAIVSSGLVATHRKLSKLTD